MKHAWLIIAHNEFGILQRLVSMLDDAQSDIYVHIDKKVQQLPEIHADKARLFVLGHRVDVRWGTFSQIETELELLAAAAEQGSFDYCHIISGTTLPLRSFDDLDAYFSQADGKAVMTGLCQDEPYQETLKIHRYNLFMRDYASPDGLRRKSSQFFWKTSIAVQRVLGIRTNRDGDFYKASNWLSLPEEAVRYLLSRRSSIEKKYRYSFCGDEFFVPSELMESPDWRQRIVNDEKYLKHDMGRANAGTFHLSDYPALQQTGYVFARKFTA
jgi:hypothetical protein